MSLWWAGGHFIRPNMHNAHILTLQTTKCNNQTNDAVEVPEYVIRLFANVYMYIVYRPFMALHLALPRTPLTALKKFCFGIYMLPNTLPEFSHGFLEEVLQAGRDFPSRTEPL